MGRHVHKPAARGSEKWLQRVVNECPDLLNADLARGLGLADGESVGWLSPLTVDELAEIERYGVGEPK